MFDKQEFNYYNFHQQIMKELQNKDIISNLSGRNDNFIYEGDIKKELNQIKPEEKVFKAIIDPDNNILNKEGNNMKERIKENLLKDEIFEN